MTATQARTTRTGEKLLGRVAFVTGGTRGIGSAICRSFAQQGADVAAGYSGNQERAEMFAQDFAGAYPESHMTVHRGDIASPDDCRRTVAEVIEQHGRLDILVNNAGITVDRTVLKMTDDDWRRVIDVNLSGAFYLSQAALRHMIERGSGRIVMISSVIGEMGGIGQSNYASAKAGLLGLTKTLAREAAMQVQRSGKADGIGITVNAVTPGYTATEMPQGEDPDRPARRAGGGSPRRPFHGRGCLRLHHRTSLGCQRRHGHVRHALSRSHNGGRSASAGPGHIPVSETPRSAAWTPSS